MLTLIVRLEADRLESLDPMADTTPNALMARSGCYSCLPDHVLLTLIVRLLADLAETPSAPSGSGTVLTGSGNPEGVAVGDPGAFYYDTANRQLFIKESGAGNTGWALIA